MARYTAFPAADGLDGLLSRFQNGADVTITTENGAKLGTATLPAPAWAATSSGSAAAQGLPLAVTHFANGIAARALVHANDVDGDHYIRVTVGEAGSGAEMILSSVNFDGVTAITIDAFNANDGGYDPSIVPSNTDADATKWLTATAAGRTTWTPTHEQAVHDFLITLKDAGVYAKLHTFQMLYRMDKIAAALIDVVQRDVNGDPLALAQVVNTAGTAFTDADLDTVAFKGLRGTGSAGINTGLSAIDIGEDNMTMGSVFEASVSTHLSGHGMARGSEIQDLVGTGSPPTQIQAASSPDSGNNQITITSGLESPGPGPGYFAWSRGSATDFRLYKAALADTAVTLAGSNPTAKEALIRNYSMHYMAIHDPTQAAGAKEVNALTTADRVGCFFIAQSLTQADHDALFDAIKTLRTALLA